MLVQEVTHVSLDSFRQRSAGKKIVLIYPWTNYRNLFLTYFLSSAQDGLLYYRISDEQISLHNWLDGLITEFKSVLGNFGNNVQQALKENKPSVLGEALATDLADYSSGEPLILFIDELDRVALDADFNHFMRALVAALPNHVQIAFSSRLLTYQPWYDMVTQRRSDRARHRSAPRRHDVHRRSDAETAA